MIKNSTMNLDSIEHVTRDQIESACRALGLDPDATHSITITADGVAAEVIEGDTFARYVWPVV